VGKKLSFVIITLVLILVALPLSIAVFNEVILRSNAPGPLRLAAVLFSPPKDLYEPLVTELLTITDGRAEKSIIFRHKYRRSYEVGILLDRFEPYGSDIYELDIVAHLTCYVGGELRYSQPPIKVESGRPFFAKRSGFSLTFYEVPKDLPLGEQINCVFTMESINAELIKEHGPAYLYVKKMSDL